MCHFSKSAHITVSHIVLALMNCPTHLSDSQGTPDGDRKSEEYNIPLREATMKFAMLAMLRSPPHGFEAVVRNHFRINAGMYSGKFNNIANSIVGLGSYCNAPNRIDYYCLQQLDFNGPSPIAGPHEGNPRSVGSGVAGPLLVT